MKRERRKAKGKGPEVVACEKKITKKQGQSDFLRQTFEQTKKQNSSLGHPPKRLICGQLEAYFGQSTGRTGLGNLAK